MTCLAVIVAAGTHCAVRGGGSPSQRVGPGDDDDDDETPIGDPPDDDGDDDWDDDDDDDDYDDEEPVQALDIALQHRNVSAVAAKWRPIDSPTVTRSFASTMTACGSCIDIDLGSTEL